MALDETPHSDPPEDPDIARVRAVLETRLAGGQAVASRIGRFVVIERIGAGGMGVVFAAFDPQLDRKVAIKLLSAGATSEQERARLVREAKAMASLSHPNVVGVFEVGEHQGRIFVAMEYVRGRTLRRWFTERPRSSQEILDVCVQAGRGLAAAHAAGIVHRDFKPDNVLVGDDERARVFDFGLARRTVEEISDAQLVDSRDTSVTSTLTRTGAVLGTPAYMSPEQIRGRTVDAHADQFGFCVTMWEAFAGRRPFAGDSVQRLFDNVTRGDVMAPDRSTMPGWVESLLRRGLAQRPEDRHAGMGVLLDALERGVRRGRQNRIAIAASLVALVGGGIWGAREVARRYARAQAVAGCTADGASIEETWNDETRTRVQEAILATRVGYAEITAAKVMPWLDANVQAWRDARTEACLDAGVHARWDAETFERSLWCLDERRMELEALLDELTSADASVVQHAVSAAAGLTSIAPCLDTIALARLVPPPAERREEIRATRMELSRVSALRQAGKYTDALAHVRTADAGATAVQWPPLSAAVRAHEAAVYEQLGRYDDAVTAGTKAYLDSARVGAWDVAASTATLLVLVAGDRLQRHTDGLAWAAHAEVALAHAGDPEQLREANRLGNVALVHYRSAAFEQAQLLLEQAIAIREQSLGQDHPELSDSLGNLALVHTALGEFPRARELFERSIAIEEAALGPDHPDVAASIDGLANVLMITAEYAGARALHERALAIREHAFGEHHPDVAKSLANLANVLHITGDYALERALDERALAIREASLGPEHPEVGLLLNNIALIHESMGETGLALPLFERALAIREKALGLEHPDVAQTLNNLANALDTAGETARARAAYERAIAILEKVYGPDHPDAAALLVNLAHIHAADGDRPRAQREYEHAIAIWEKSLGPEHPLVGAGLFSLAHVVWRLGEHDSAVAQLERALAIFEHHEGVQFGEIDTRFALADFLVRNGGDRVRARALAEQARDAWRAGSANAEDLAEVEKWLARQPAR